MTERNDANTIRTAFWMPLSLPQESNFKFADDRNSKAACGDMGDVAGPQPAPKPRTGWHDDSLND